MTEIKYYVDETKEIDKEIKRINEHLKSLKKRKKDIENKIQTYLINRNINGMRCGNSVVKINQTNQRKRKMNKEKENDIKTTLNEAGIYNNVLINKIISQTKGEIRQQTKLKIT